MAKKDKNDTPAEETVEEVVEETVEETAQEPAEPEVPEVNEWEEKYNAEHDSYLRLAADYDNYRKRTLKEKSSPTATAKQTPWKSSYRSMTI